MAVKTVPLAEVKYQLTLISDVRYSYTHGLITVSYAREGLREQR